MICFLFSSTAHRQEGALGDKISNTSLGLSGWTAVFQQVKLSQVTCKATPSVAKSPAIVAAQQYQHHAYNAGDYNKVMASDA